MCTTKTKSSHKNTKNKQSENSKKIDSLKTFE